MRCDDGNNRNCGNRRCIQKELVVNCSCDMYTDSEEINILARGTDVLFFSKWCNTHYSIKQYCSILLQPGFEDIK